MSDMTPPPVPPYQPAPPAPPAPPMAPAGGGNSNSKLIALLGWIFAPLGLIALLLDDYKGDKYVKSNVIQAAAVWLVLVIIGMVVAAVTFGIGGLFWWIVQYAVQIFYAIQAYNGKDVQVPVVYGLVKSMIES